MAVGVEQPPKKQTTGFGKVFKNLSGQLSEDTSYTDTDGVRKLKATPAQVPSLSVCARTHARARARTHVRARAHTHTACMHAFGPMGGVDGIACCGGE
jgi:hypothetical protein